MVIVSILIVVMGVFPFEGSSSSKNFDEFSHRSQILRRWSECFHQMCDDFLEFDPTKTHRCQCHSRRLMQTDVYGIFCAQLRTNQCSWYKDLRKTPRMGGRVACDESVLL